MILACVKLKVLWYRLAGLQKRANLTFLVATLLALPEQQFWSNVITFVTEECPEILLLLLMFPQHSVSICVKVYFCDFFLKKMIKYYSFEGAFYICT